MTEQLILYVTSRDSLLKPTQHCKLMILQFKKKGRVNQTRKENISVFLKDTIFSFNVNAAAAAKSHQSFLTLCDPVDGSPHPWLPHPWDSPGKNTRVGCHFLLQCMKMKSESEVTQLCPTLRNPMD